MNTSAPSKFAWIQQADDDTNTFIFFNPDSGEEVARVDRKGLLEIIRFDLRCRRGQYTHEDAVPANYHAVERAVHREDFKQKLVRLHPDGSITTFGPPITPQFLGLPMKPDYPGASIRTPAYEDAMARRIPKKRPAPVDNNSLKLSTKESNMLIRMLLNNSAPDTPARRPDFPRRATKPLPYRQRPQPANAVAGPSNAPANAVRHFSPRQRSWIC
ncbi:hypothetical protein HGRIS_009054 [Hohenbuehelia grisea]|uniref:Uncharacterized protein n=1 Tax=Hohenbuehelia grisea TaxID=104357 RepID=A0ABR3J000_9AGAR